MRTSSLALLVLPLLFGCPVPPPVVVEPEPDAGQCSTLDAGCSDTQACCDGSSCSAGHCACVAVKGALCGGANPVCCTGLTCDATGRCQLPCDVDGGCRSPGDTCTAPGDCCAPATCLNGTCDVVERCKGNLDDCTADTDCCGDPAIGSRPACVTTTAGRKCRFSARGEACTTATPCAPNFACLDAGTGVPGSCGIEVPSPACTLNTATCARGAACDPNTNVNQGYDPCGIRNNGGTLQYRSQVLSCHGGVCDAPRLFESCNSACGVTPNESRRPAECVDLDTNSKVCLETCTTNADCGGQFYLDDLTSSIDIGILSSGAPIAMWCVPHPDLNKSFCQPQLCYEDGAPGRDDKRRLYQPCAGQPNSICLPQSARTYTDFFGDSVNSNTFGFCQAVSPDPAPSVGKACDVRAGTESPAALCGPDALCIGQRCQKLCDASVPEDGSPACAANETCVEPYSFPDTFSANQIGICSPRCDPFADETNSGCETWCGGPRSRCNWHGWDRPFVNAHCAPMAQQPKRIGEACDKTMQCETGALCWALAGAKAACVQLCDLEYKYPYYWPGCKIAGATCKPYGTTSPSTKVGACQL